MAILMVYERYEYEGKLKEEFFFSTALPRRTTGAEISKAIIDYIENKGLDMKNCVGVCSDGAAGIIGEKLGVNYANLAVGSRMCFSALFYS